MYTITMDKKLMTADAVKLLMAQSYWAKDRSTENIVMSMKHSECVGLLCEDELVGFARVVTDYSTMFWLCDVLIDEHHRGKGLGKKLIEHIQTLEFYKPLKGILATKDAHGLYEHYGFKKEPEKYMSKNRGV